MIFENLVIHDYGVFGGRVEIPLKPTSPDKPVVLFGGLNGRGKTTILDAIQIVLYGQRANVSNRGKLSWDKYISDSIRRSCFESSIALDFSTENEHGIQQYRIVRSWEKKKSAIKESVDVLLNGKPDRLLSTQWDEHIESLLPVRIAALNFFDGEKIETLADPEKSSGVIRAAIDSLLGVGLLEKLHDDLNVLIKRGIETKIEPISNEEISTIENQLISLDKSLDSEVRIIENRIAQREVARARLVEIETKAKVLGSEQWENRGVYENQLTEQNDQLRSLETELLEVISGPAPLQLVNDLLNQALARTHEDSRTLQERAFSGEIKERDKQILLNVDAASKESLHKFIESDYKSRETISTRIVLFDDPDHISTVISDVQTLIQIEDGVSELLENHQIIEREIIEITRVLAKVPADNTIIPMIEQKAELRGELKRFDEEILALEESTSTIRNSIERLKSRRNRIFEAEADLQVQSLNEKRIREYARTAVQIVDSLAEKTIQRNISLIEVAILEKLKVLLGKQKMITDLRIDPSSLEILISTSKDTDLPIDRLSAGERQLLAIATLWGLSSVSGRPLPLVIDTPLGRLDSDHRLKLITHYFPNASKQVIILSTDEEIDTALHKKLKKSIGLEYVLEYDDELSSTKVREGYFLESPHGD
jgi:DNA sulfur modification protein DndD